MAAVSPDIFRLGRLHWVMETSLLKTLAKQASLDGRQDGQEVQGRHRHPRRAAQVLQVAIERDRGRKPLVTRFGGVPLRRVRTAVLTDQRPVMASAKRNELIHRLLAGRCELCEGTAGLEVHHVRKLADLNKPGRREKPPWMNLMAKRRRKTLLICRRCHEDIHGGRATTPYPKRPLESRVRGNPQALFGKRRRKRTRPRAPRRRSTSLDGPGLETGRDLRNRASPRPNHLLVLELKAASAKTSPRALLS